MSQPNLVSVFFETKDVICRAVFLVVDSHEYYKFMATRGV